MVLLSASLFSRPVWLAPIVQPDTCSWVLHALYWQWLSDQFFQNSPSSRFSISHLTSLIKMQQHELSVPIKFYWGNILNDLQNFFNSVEIKIKLTSYTESKEPNIFLDHQPVLFTMAKRLLKCLLSWCCSIREISFLMLNETLLLQGQRLGIVSPTCLQIRSSSPFYYLFKW